MIEKFNKNIITTAITNGSVIIIGTISSIIIARYLGAEKKGVYSVLLAFVSLLLYLGNYGITNAICYFSAKKHVNQKVLFQQSYILSLLSSFSICLLGIILFLFIPKFNSLEIHPMTLMALLLSLPLNISNNYLINIYLGRKKINFFNFISYLKIISELFFVTLFIIQFNFGLAGAIYGYLLSSLITFTAIQIKSKKYFEIHKPKIDFLLIKKMLLYGYKAYLSNLFLYINLYMDLFLVYFFLGPISTGIYSIASTLIRQLGFLPTAMNQILLPYSVENKHNNKMLFLRNSIFILLMFYLLIAPILYIWGQSIIIFFFGNQFSNSIFPLRILLLSMLPLGLWKIFSGQIYGAGKPGQNTISSGISAITNITANFILIPKYGLVGAAYSSVISYTIMFTISCFQILILNKK